MDSSKNRTDFIYIFYECSLCAKAMTKKCFFKERKQLSGISIHLNVGLGIGKL